MDRIQLDGLDAADLLALRRAIEAQLAEVATGDGEPVGGSDGAWPAASLPPKTGGGRRGGGWIETKVIHGRAYLYRRWREGGRKRSKYLGPAGGS